MKNMSNVLMSKVLWSANLLAIMEAYGSSIEHTQAPE